MRDTASIRSFKVACSSSYPYLWNQLLLHSINLILFTLLLVHLILRISPHHSHPFTLSLAIYYSLSLSLQT